MHVVIDLSEALVDRIRRLVDTGRYSSINSFLLLAAENQLTLENAEGDVVSSHKEPDAIVSDFNFEKYQVEPDKSKLIHTLKPLKADVLGFFPGKGTWIWGQINNLLAVKFASRVLLRLQYESNDPIQASRVYEEVEKEALDFGQFLIQLDNQAERSRIQRWSKSFPSKNPRSLKRFSRQYVGGIQQDGIIYGSLSRLGLATWVQMESDVKIGLTSTGVEFAELENPILDSAESEPSKKMSVKEIQYYLKSILKASEMEKEAFTTIAKLFKTHKNLRPRVLWAEMEDLYPKWSDKMAATYSNGVIARMEDLKLVSRINPGLPSVEYVPSEEMKGLQ